MSEKSEKAQLKNGNLSTIKLYIYLFLYLLYESYQRYTDRKKKTNLEVIGFDDTDLNSYFSILARHNTPCVRNVDLLCSKHCEGEYISLRQGVAACRFVHAYRTKFTYKEIFSRAQFLLAFLQGHCNTKTASYHMLRGSSGDSVFALLQGKMDKNAQARPAPTWIDDIKSWTKLDNYRKIKAVMLVLGLGLGLAASPCNYP